MRKEAVMLTSALVAILALVGVVVTPEDREAIEAIFVVVLPLALGLLARSQVASKETVSKEADSLTQTRIFPRK